MFWSLLANLLAYLAVSLATLPKPIERLQASAFIDPDRRESHAASGLWGGSVKVGELQAVAARYLGAERAQRSFETFAAERAEILASAADADLRLVRHTERLLASAIGAASARLVLALALERRSVGAGSALRLLDDATAAIQYNRDLLEATVENVAQGISVFDKDLRLVCWNRRFLDLLDLPADLGQAGVPLQTILRFSAQRGEYGPGKVEELVAQELDRFRSLAGAIERQRSNGAVLEIRTGAMPGGGYVTTYSDITERVRTAAALASANETLEQRVRARTAELARAKAAAEEANLDKTRFLAAASHDLLQPLNAARLYVSSLLERRTREARPVTADGELVRKIDASLASVEELLGALLDISKLDAGALIPERGAFRLDELFAALRVEFAPIAERRGLRLRIVPCTLTVESDWRLLHRVLQNLLANALRYTHRGGVLMGARRADDHVRIQVVDTGAGIPHDKQALAFKEFQRFAAGPDAEHGLGLGLSIVQRIGRILDHPISLRSEPGRGTAFTVQVPSSLSPVTVAAPAAAVQPTLGPAQAAVLCIDNQTSILDGMQSLLRNWSCDVRTAAGLADLEGLFERDPRPPDLVIADFHLDGGADGIACIEAVRRRFGADVPAILITADRSEEI